MASPTPERIAGYEVHPVASVLPLMEGEELDAFAHDVRVNGLRHPIVLHEGKVLDGRNRLLACERTGIEPRFVQWDCLGGSPASFVASENIKRRHLTPSQKAMFAAKLLPFFEAEAKERQRAAARATNEKLGRTVTAPGPEASSVGTSAAQAAEKMDAAERSVRRAKAVAQASPELAAKVLEGKATLKQAEKQLQRADQVKKVKAYELPEGEYAVIVADPPWRYDDELDGSDAARGGTPYPTMTAAEIAAMKVPAAKDCILWLWVTNAHLLDGSAHKVLEGWGFEPKTMATWPKPKMGVGRWLRGQTEHVILAVRGKPVVDLVKETTLLPSWPVGVHSAKPADFFDWAERLCPAPASARLELFARGERHGWVTSGAEVSDDFVDPATNPEVWTAPRATKKEASKRLSWLALQKEATALGWTVRNVSARSSSYVLAKCASCGTTFKIPGSRGGVDPMYVTQMKMHKHEGPENCIGFPVGACDKEGTRLCYDCAQAKSRAYRHPALKVDCPDCPSQKGALCNTGSGVVRARPHVSRQQAAEKAKKKGRATR